MEEQSTLSNDELAWEGATPTRTLPHQGGGNCIDLGLTNYQDTHQLQLQLHSSITSQKSNEVIIITEHFPVYTCGRTTKPQDLPKKSRIPIIDIERGGELTYHGPGQIVGYPILNLTKRHLSIPQYLRRLEEALINALLKGGVEARYRKECLAGVWVGDKKVASIGVAVRRWVTFHGFALNCDLDLGPFRMVNPCGMLGDKVTSLKELGIRLPKETVREWIKEELLRAFF